MAILRINAIKCIEQEDTWGDDDIYIAVNGSSVWGPQAMDDEQTRPVNVEVAFNRSVEIMLFEVDDADPNDNLGQKELRASDEGEHHLKFTEDDANYSLWVTIVNTKKTALPPMLNRKETVARADEKVFSSKSDGKVASVGGL